MAILTLINPRKSLVRSGVNETALRTMKIILFPHNAFPALVVFCVKHFNVRTGHIGLHLTVSRCQYVITCPLVATEYVQHAVGDSQQWEVPVWWLDMGITTLSVKKIKWLVTKCCEGLRT